MSDSISEVPYQVVSEGDDPRPPVIEAALDDGTAVAVIDDCIRVTHADRTTNLHLGGRAHRACVARGAGLVAVSLERKRFTFDSSSRLGAYFLVNYQTLVFDTASGNLARLEIPTRHETELAISPDGTTLVTFQPEYAIWALPGGTRLATIKPSGLVFNAATFDAAGRRFAALFDGNPNPLAELNDRTPWQTELRLWQRDGMMVFADLGSYQSADYLGFTDDGSAVVALNRDLESVVAWDTTTGKRRPAQLVPTSVEPGLRVRARSRRDAGRNVRLVVLDDGRFEITEPVAPTRLSMLTGVDIHYPFALCQAGAVAAALAWPARTGSQPEVVRWTVDSERRLAPLRPPSTDAPLSSLALSNDGRWAAAGCADWQVYLWNLATEELHAELRGHQATVDGVGFSPDNSTLYSRARDGAVFSWAV